MARDKSTRESPDLLSTAKSVGSLVRRATLEKRKLSDGFIKVPSQCGYTIPVSSSSGHEVLWKAVKTKETWKPPISTNTRLKLDRFSEIQAVHNLVLEEGTGSHPTSKKNMKTTKTKIGVEHNECALESLEL